MNLIQSKGRNNRPSEPLGVISNPISVLEVRENILREVRQEKISNCLNPYLRNGKIVANNFNFARVTVMKSDKSENAGLPTIIRNLLCAFCTSTATYLG